MKTIILLSSKRVTIALFVCCIDLCCPSLGFGQHRVIVSTDIGGTDDDDFQSMIHYLMYADRFQTEGLISSPHGDGRKEDILHVIDLYEQDYDKLKAHSNGFPTPGSLRAVTKQGAIERAPLKGWRESTEGSDWIIKCARRDVDKPLWVLVWGGLEDVVQALHDAPDIADRLRVYWIAGPNKKWGADAYQYLASNFPDLWMIESNATYRGLFEDDRSAADTNVKNYYDAHIKGRGALGGDFIHYYKGVIKMGDTPTVAYLLDGSPEDAGGDSWGGSYIPLTHSSRRIFERSTTLADTVPTFSLMEWVFQGPEQDLDQDKPCLWLEIENQQFDGFYEGEGRYRVRFVTKSTGNWSYRVSSAIDALNGLSGEFVSVDPWPGAPHEQDFHHLKGWLSDDPNPDLFEGGHQGAKTIYQWQKDFLEDWAQRWAWLE